MRVLIKATKELPCSYLAFSSIAVKIHFKKSNHFFCFMFYPVTTLEDLVFPKKNLYLFEWLHTVITGPLEMPVKYVCFYWKNLLRFAVSAGSWQRQHGYTKNRLAKVHCLFWSKNKSYLFSLLIGTDVSVLNTSGFFFPGKPKQSK